MKDCNVIADRIRDLGRELPDVTGGFSLCSKFNGCPDEIKCECPAMLTKVERWCWLASGIQVGLKVPPIASVVPYTQCDIYKAVRHSMGDEA
ncbi:MAG: hypothetical protein L7F77_08735 [Candidatus Magnetominusculus sp. LBB02]|nr:hypothetical protein [Candidatus Magnetominusculus sp. LBB02]MCG6552400.1 hypothetical protein [Candidatus Magnetominusculus sp. LBB02]